MSNRSKWIASLLASLAFAAPAPADTTPAAVGPWSANLTLYLWFLGVDGKFSAGPFNTSVNASFIDIAGKLRNFPLAFMGRVEGHYDRFGFYLDGNYLDLDFKPRFNGGISRGLSTQLGIMEYGATYRLFGPTNAERVARWDQKAPSNIIEVYAGGRTIWLENQIEFRGIGTASASKTLTSPLVGGRVEVEFTPAWFVRMDGNVGGFGADNIDFAGSVLGVVGYRTTLFGLPASAEAGYRALRLDVSQRILDTRATLNGPFIGLTGYW